MQIDEGHDLDDAIEEVIWRFEFPRTPSLKGETGDDEEDDRIQDMAAALAIAADSLTGFVPVGSELPADWTEIRLLAATPKYKDRVLAALQPRLAKRFCTGTEQMAQRCFELSEEVVPGSWLAAQRHVELLSRCYIAGFFAEVIIVAGSVTLAALRRRFPEVTVIEPEEIFGADVDVFAPWALGAQVNSQTIPRLRAQLVVGAANNILEDDVRDAEELRRRGITYVPDFHANRMGIVNCCDEALGWDPAAVRTALDRVYPETVSLLMEAKTQDVSPVVVAQARADARAAEPHPLYPGRGTRLIHRLVESDWADRITGESLVG